MDFRPTPEELASGMGERRKTLREALPVQPRASATFPCAGSSGLMPRAAHCLEGHWVRMRPGAAVMAHQRRQMAVGCHRPRAQRRTSCSAVTGVSSAALRGVECLAPSHFFQEPSVSQDTVAQLHRALPRALDLIRPKMARFNCQW